MTTRRQLLAALSLSALTPRATLAQQSARVYRIGFLGAATAASYGKRVEALRLALRDLGYLENRNVIYEYRWTEGNNQLLPEMAAQLVGARCDVIVTGGTPAILALKQATDTLPIIMAESGDAVAAGLVKSLARPGGNVTGMTHFSPELTAKRLELLKETMPRLARVAYLVDPDSRITPHQIAALEHASDLLRVKFQVFGSRNLNDFPNTFSAIAKARMQGVVTAEDTVHSNNYDLIAALALRNKIPSIGGKAFADSGGVIGYGVNFLDQYRRVAVHVQKILNGTRPADIPVEQPTRFEFVVNMKTARTLRIKIPHSILLRAGEVIE